MVCDLIANLPLGRRFEPLFCGCPLHVNIVHGEQGIPTHQIRWRSNEIADIFPVRVIHISGDHEPTVGRKRIPIDHLTNIERQKERREQQRRPRAARQVQASHL